MHKFCEKKLQIFCKQPGKGNLHIFSFSWLKIRLFKILQKFCISKMAWSRAFRNCIFFHFLDNFFCKHFYYVTGFCDKKFNFCKFANFFADSKSRAQELSNDVSFVIFEHQTWDLEGGSNWPLPSISWFSSTPAEIGLKLKPTIITTLRVQRHFI